MDRPQTRYAESIEQEFERMTAADDSSASRAVLASGVAVPIARADTPMGHVLRVYPDGREELVRVDRAHAARVLGG